MVLFLSFLLTSEAGIRTASGLKFAFFKFALDAFRVEDELLLSVVPCVEDAGSSLVVLVLEPRGMSTLVWSGEGIRRDDVVLELGVPTPSLGACTTISMCDAFSGLHTGCYWHVSTRILDYSNTHC